ncbi:MAG: GIY-YIG nuclease family protein [Bdellovibrio sp.]|nr:GIY-YIG nuclease family protein [Methylotenera sp.]
MLPSITFLDLETTGATPLRDRITEIALVRFDNGIETARWQTLVNPEQPIPPFIQQLTTINNDMVANAPVFKDVADTLLSFLEGSVLAAHNVRFDHGFIKSEFKRIGFTLRQKVICTVKLSRLLYPQHKSHGLDAIMQRHNLTTIARHRAMGDVDVMLAFIESARLELGDAAINKAAAQLMNHPTLPPHLDASLLDDMPETPGVYLFFGDSDLPLYIGKSTNIRARILSHFSSDHASTKEMRIAQEIKHIEWITTAGDFSALMLESRLVKQRQPIHNRQLRNERQLYSWKLTNDANAKNLLELVREKDINPAELSNLYGTFKSKHQALETLRNIANAHQLCPRLIGLEAWVKGACFASQIKQCKGACCGRETPETHYLRLQMALITHKLKSWPFAGKIAIKEKNSENDKTQMHVFEHWTYLGSAENDDELAEIELTTAQLTFDLETYKLLLKTVNSAKTQIIVM